MHACMHAYIRTYARTHTHTHTHTYTHTHTHTHTNTHAHTHAHTHRIQALEKRRRGRPKKKWADNITEWTGKSFSTTQALAHNRSKWSQLVQRSSLQCLFDRGGGYGSRRDFIYLCLYIYIYTYIYLYIYKKYIYMVRGKRVLRPLMCFI